MANQPPARTGRMHVLIVDEDPAVRSACCEIATSRGFIPYGTDNLGAARSSLRWQQRRHYGSGFEIAGRSRT